MSSIGASRALRTSASRLLPPLALMVAIFVLSSRPDLDTGLGLADLIGRKLGHAAVFGGLWALWLRAFGFRLPWLAAAIAVGYAVTDEYHQTFVAGRHGTVLDVAIDAAGVAIAWVVWLGLRRRRSEPAALRGDEHRLGPVDRAQLPVDVVEVGADGAGRER